MLHHDELTGTIDRFLFRNAENGYSVFILLLGKQEPITVIATSLTAQAGEQVTVQGSWITHPKFGKQFQATSCNAMLPTSTTGLKKYLGSGLIKGIGKGYAEKLVNTFGTNILTVIDQEPHLLSKVPGIGPSRIEKIITGWQAQKEISTIMVFLQDKGVSPAYATKIYKKYGKESIAKVQENPYRLADEIWGIGFKIADSIAQNMGFEQGSIKRIKAGIVFSITQLISNGNLYGELAQVKEKTFELLALDATEHEKTMKHALHELYDTGKIKLISHDSKHFITLSQYYFTEKGVAGRLTELNNRPSTLQFTIDAIYQTLRTPKEKEIALNEDQQRGIMACLQNKVSIITGGPGTGKTTLIRKLLDILDEYKIVYKLAAPTGRAAKRIIEGTGRHALTLHRLLEFDFATMNFVHNEQNALKVQFLIIDESSMIDIFLAHAILKALPFTAHILFIGDIDQLPSVGAGNFLNDLIASQKVVTTKLTHIFRQAQDSLIIVNAHRVNAGEFPQSFLPDAKRDFIFIKEDVPENVAGHLKTIYESTLAKHYIAPDNSIVLAPMHRGVVGTQKLNLDLQALLNADQPDGIARAGSVYKVGDKVMQLKNNYDKSVFNGDIGIIEVIDQEERTIKVRLYEDRLLEYEFDELDELVHAYAISIHKSQGSEYQAVIIPLFMHHFTLLQRNLLYTAITRAKKLCIVIGQTRAIAMAIKNNKGLARTTFLKEFLTTDLQCRS